MILVADEAPVRKVGVRPHGPDGLGERFGVFEGNIRGCADLCKEGQQRDGGMIRKGGDATLLSV